MPFPNQAPRAFTKENILALNPGQMGCYGLYRPGTWVYVGKGDIRQRLLDHFNGDNPCITRERPTHWVDVVCSDYDTREKQLTLELKPLCNQRVG
jgi:allophanate hydrolase subunit 1